MTNEVQINSFKESQRFNQIWLWVVLAFSASLPIVLEFLTTLKKHNPDFRTAGGVSVTMFIFTILLLRMFHLKTVVDDNGVYYRFIPIHTRPVFAPWADLEKIYVKKYKPLREFGGWGMRISFRNGTAYNISGNMGLQLVYKNGKKILIGTCKPDDLNEVLSALVQRGVISEEMVVPV